MNTSYVFLSTLIMCVLTEHKLSEKRTATCKRSVTFSTTQNADLSCQNSPILQWGSYE